MQFRMLLWLLPMVILFSTKVTAQNAISFSLHQDLRLLTIGDNRGNNAGTLDILTRLKYSGNVRENGYYFYYLEYENASIKNNYNRLGLGFGYALTHFLNNQKIFVACKNNFFGTRNFFWSGMIFEKNNQKNF